MSADPIFNFDGESDFPEGCVCENPGEHYYSGVPGVLARVVGGVVLSNVERCDECQRLPCDAEASRRLEIHLRGSPLRTAASSR